MFLLHRCVKSWLASVPVTKVDLSSTETRRTACFGLSSRGPPRIFLRLHLRLGSAPLTFGTHPLSTFVAIQTATHTLSRSPISRSERRLVQDGARPTARAIAGGVRLPHLVPRHWTPTGRAVVSGRSRCLDLVWSGTGQLHRLYLWHEGIELCACDADASSVGSAVRRLSADQHRHLAHGRERVRLDLGRG